MAEKFHISSIANFLFDYFSWGVLGLIKKLFSFLGKHVLKKKHSIWVLSVHKISAVSY